MITCLARTLAVKLGSAWQQSLASSIFPLRMPRACAVGVATVGLIFSLVPVDHASAQVLNNKLVELLGNNCSGLGATG